MSSQWKLVPVEPTETMVINGFESVPDECFTDEEVWEQYQEMSGCQQAAFRAKLCWAAMLGCAPAPDTHIAVLEESAAVDFGIDGRSVRVSQEAYSIFLAREAGGREKIAALQQSLTAADERADVLEGLVVKQAALLDELGIPLDEVDDLFGETLKNAKRYEYLRSVMAVENFPAPHPAWSEPSDVYSKRIDDLCDAALKPAEGRGDEA